MRRILIVHNRYAVRGGEDAVVDAESELLRRHGHHIEQLLFENAAIADASRLTTGLGAIYSPTGRAQVAARVRTFRPDIVHFHNTFPLVSPYAYSVARASGAAVVQTLHNYRIQCANALLLRNEEPCTLCVGRTVQAPAIRYRCYRGRLGSAAVVAMNAVHHTRGTWKREVDRFVALTRFAKQVFMRAGIPPDRIAVKANFAEEGTPHDDLKGNRFLYVGRLSPEKGIVTLLTTMRRRNDLQLDIYGDGPLSLLVNQIAAECSNVNWHGAADRSTLAAAMHRACGIVVPSKCFEGFPRVVAEAYSAGLPVIATKLGGLAEIVEHGVTGLLVRPGDPDELGVAMALLRSDFQTRERMSAAAQRRFRERYSPEVNYEALCQIYATALTHRASDSCRR